MQPAAAKRWILIPRPQPAARLRLLCLPHAGAGASTYFTWGAALEPVGIEVRSVAYPGRESRFAEPRIENAAAMVRALADQWSDIAGPGPYGIYGHSMGALLGFELVAELQRRRYANLPRRLLVSGHQAPHLPYRAPQVHALPEREFLPTISRLFGGLPQELLADPDIAALIAATLRSDFTLVETYAWTGAAPIAVPLSFMGGTDDPWASQEDLASWSQHTTATATLRMFPGDHFFNHQARDDVLAHIVRELGDVR